MTASSPTPESSFQASNPLLADVIERNIHTLAALHLRKLEQRSTQDRVADTITTFAGSMRFVYIHVAWFGLWIMLNLGFLGIPPFDPFPFGLLTMVVSLEAIFLATFVMVSQNRMGEEADHRADLALQIGILSEYEITRALQMLNAIQDKLGIDNERDAELADLERTVYPEMILQELHRVQLLHLAELAADKPPGTPQN